MGSSHPFPAQAFHEPCGEVDAVRELARPGWLAVVLELLNGRDEALFLGAVRFCQRCAASCEGAMRHVLKEVLAFGGRPLERAIVGGLASGPNRGGRGALAGCACLELLAQLTTFPPVWKSNLQPDFNVRVFECFDTSSSAGLRELDESDRSVQKSAESTSI